MSGTLGQFKCGAGIERESARKKKRRIGERDLWQRDLLDGGAGSGKAEEKGGIKGRFWEVPVLCIDVTGEEASYCELLCCSKGLSEARKVEPKK